MQSYNLNLRRDVEDGRDFPFLCSLNIDELKSGILQTSNQIVDHSSLMSSVKDQGTLGTCVGFAVAAMKEWQEQKEYSIELAEGKHNHKDDKYYDLAESWIYWNAKKIDGYPNDEGTSIRYAMKVLNKIGVPCEKAWPYSDEVKGEPTVWSKLISRWSVIGSYYRITNLLDLKVALTKSPVVLGIACFEEIFNVDSSGIVKIPKNPNVCYGGHAICACGFDDTKKLVKFKNSWSPYWGERGYGYLPYDYINSYMWDAWTSVDLSVTKDMLKGSCNVL
jgi:C1A family cysteine protease